MNYPKEIIGGKVSKETQLWLMQKMVIFLSGKEQK